MYAGCGISIHSVFVISRTLQQVSIHSVLIGANPQHLRSPSSYAARGTSNHGVFVVRRGLPNWCLKNRSLSFSRHLVRGRPCRAIICRFRLLLSWPMNVARGISIHRVFVIPRAGTQGRRSIVIWCVVVIYHCAPESFPHKRLLSSCPFNAVGRISIHSVFVIQLCDEYPQLFTVHHPPRDLDFFIHRILKLSRRFGASQIPIRRPTTSIMTRDRPGTNKRPHSVPSLVCSGGVYWTVKEL